MELSAYFKTHMILNIIKASSALIIMKLNVLKVAT